MIAIAIDLGGTRIKIGLVENDKVFATTVLDAFSDEGLKSRLPLVKKAIDELLQKHSIAKDQIAGVGFAAPGVVDTKRMRILSINDKYNDALDVDFMQWAKESWGVPLFLENDARAALVGEWKYGAGKNCDNVVGITLGTGVGASAVIEGNVLRGKHFLAGILGGHLIVNYNGKNCNCGNIGCVEAEASSWSLPDTIKSNPKFNDSALSKEGKLDFKALFDLSRKGDELAVEVRDHCLDIWSAGVINLIHAYDPEIVIINGGVMASAEIIIPHIQNKADKQAWTPWGKVKVLKAQHLDTAALLGVAYLASCQ